MKYKKKFSDLLKKLKDAQDELTNALVADNSAALDEVNICCI